MNKEELERDIRELEYAVQGYRLLVTFRRGRLEAAENIYLEKVVQLNRVRKQLEELSNS